MESPSKDLRQVVAHPLTLEPEMRHEETEKVGSSVAEENFRTDTPEVMGQVSQTEDSFLNYLYQMYRQNKFDSQCILLEKEPLPLDIQASNNNLRRSTSTVAWSSQSFNLTKMVDMLVREDVEVDSVTQKWPMDTVDGYWVKPELMPILRKIRSKHGDIVRNCTAVAVKERSLLLEMICSVILQLQEKEISKISEDFLRRQIAAVNHLKNLKVETEWLHTKLDEMLEARKILNQCGMLKEKKESNRKTLENAESKLKECQKQKKEMETKLRSLLDEKSICTETLKREMDESKRIAQNTKYVASKVRRFINYSAVDDLL